MSNRREIIQIVSEAAPTSAALGDEWVQPSTNRLYKRAVINSKPSWVEIPTSGANTSALSANGLDGIRVDGSGNVTIVKKLINNIQVVTSAENIIPNANTDSQVSVTALAVATIVNIPTGSPSDGQRLMLRFEDNGVGRGLTWITTAGGYRAVGLTLPTTTTATKVLYVGCIYNALDGFWDVIAKGEQA